MSIEVLKTKDEIKETIKLSQFAFQYKLTEEEVEKKVNRAKPNEHYVIRDEGEIASKLHHLPLEVYFGHKRMKMGGIASVATWPEFRRGGYVKQLMHYALKQMRDRGESVSMLHPFSVPFYRKYGFEMAFSYKKYTIEKLGNKHSYPGRFIRVTKADISIFNPIYEQYAKQFSGMLVRNNDWWSTRVFSEEDEIVVYENRDGEKTGYMIYQVKEEHMKIEELIALNHETRQAMFSFINNHDSMIDKVTINAVYSEQLDYYLEEPRVDQKVHPYFMARIVDVESFFQSLPLQDGLDVHLKLKVVDDFAEWNNATFTIKVQDGNITVLEKSHDSDNIDAVLSIQALTALMFGYSKANVLLEYGQMEVGKKESSSALQMLAGERSAQFIDFF